MDKAVLDGKYIKCERVVAESKRFIFKKYDSKYIVQIKKAREEKLAKIELKREREKI